MKKGGVIADISETLLELGKSTAKQGAQAVGQTFNPMQVFDKKTERPVQVDDNLKMEKITENVPNSTKLDLNKLQDNYKNDDIGKLQATRHHLFKLVKEGEEKAIMQRKQEEEERKKKEAEEEQEKKKKEQEQQQVLPEVPKGKERKSIMGAHKKKADLSHAETKPSTSKG